MKTAAVILIAGESTRFDAKKAKQVCLLNNKPVFSYSLEAFLNSKCVDEVILVTNESIKNEVEDYINTNKLNAKVILGGKTRQKSVENSFNYLNLSNDDIVIIHDGARPLIDKTIIENVKESAISNGAATVFIKETNTVTKINNGFIGGLLDRNEIAQIQTPQAFKFSVLKDAHLNAKDNLATDDSTLVINNGNKVALVLGNKKLLKITTIEDIQYLEEVLKNE